MESKILPYEQGRKKGIIIISEEGYDFAKGVKRRDEEEAL